MLGGAGAAAVLGLGSAYVLSSGNWKTVKTTVAVDLNDVARVAGPTVAVGDSGTVLEK